MKVWKVGAVSTGETRSAGSPASTVWWGRRHRQITLTRTVNEWSMLSSSRRRKIHNLRVSGVSPRPTDRRQRQKLRNTSQTLVFRSFR